MTKKKLKAQTNDDYPMKNNLSEKESLFFGLSSEQQQQGESSVSQQDELERVIETLVDLKSSNSHLSERNRQLNEMIVELKLIIARIYNKVYKLW